MTQQEMNAIKVKDRLIKQRNLLAITAAIKVMRDIDRNVSSALQMHLLDLMALRDTPVTVGRAQEKIQKLSNRLQR